MAAPPAQAALSWKIMEEIIFKKGAQRFNIYLYIQCDTNLLYFLLHFRLYHIKVHKYNFCQITTFIKVCVAIVFGLQTLQLIHFTKIYQLKCVTPQNKGHMNFYECCDLREEVVRGFKNFYILSVGYPNIKILTSSLSYM